MMSLSCCLLQNLWPKKTAYHGKLRKIRVRVEIHLFTHHNNIIVCTNNSNFKIFLIVYRIVRKLSLEIQN
jgi:hypothetical protein